MTVSLGNGVDIGNLVTAQTNPLTGGIELSAGQKKVFMPDEKQRPILCMGGDHQYKQWWGTNGNDGMAALYQDAGINPYIAICWDAEPNSSGYSEATFSDVNGFPNQVLSVEQAKTLQRKGVEFIAHGTRHPNSWSLLNSGIRIDYLGAAGSATVLIKGNGKNATEIVLVGNGGAENTTLTLTSYTTLTTLKSAIDALDGGGKWLCRIAQELAGTENPKWLWPISAARTVTGGSSPYNNRRFCISGGVAFQYTGGVHKSALVRVAAAGAVKIMMDGVRAASYAPTTETVTQMLTAVNTAVTTTFGVTGFLAEMMHNGNTAARESYMSGDELATYLTRTQEECAGRVVNITYGYPHRYAIRRQFEKLNENAAAAGLNLRNMAQAGMLLSPKHISDLPYNEWRLDPYQFGLVTANPFPIPANMDVPYHGVSTLTSSRTLPEFKATIDALCDSGPFAVDFLMHKVLPDGTSGYSFPTTDLTYYDMVEADFVALVQHIGAKKAAGLLDVEPPEQFRIARRTRQRPKNLVFNPRFVNREVHGGAALLGVTNAAGGSVGYAIPGWACGFPSGAGSFAAVSVANGALTVTTNGALSTSLRMMQQAVWLTPGKEYDLGMLVDASELTAGSIQLNIRAQRGTFKGMVSQTTAPYTLGGQVYAGTMHEAAMKFTPELPESWSPSRIMSKAGPFNLISSPSHIKVTADYIGLTADINIAGATPTATTAKEIAAAINAGIASTAAYATKPEYHTMARAENSRVVIEGPNRMTEPRAFGVTVTAGTTNGQLAAVFGGSEVQSAGSDALDDAGRSLFMLEIFVPSGTNGTFTISNVFASEVFSG